MGEQYFTVKSLVTSNIVLQYVKYEVRWYSTTTYSNDLTSVC